MLFHAPSILSLGIFPLIQLGFVVALLVLAWCAPKLGESVLSPLERLAVRLASRKNLVLIGIALTAIVARVSLLWLVPVPVPVAHDEFGYLLASDTFAHGRLTNPPHPMWVFLDTINVIQHPTYMSKYPPAQGAVLAVGQKLGQPWIGVLVSIATMCAAITWMLQGWMPPPWALLGGVLAILRFGVFNYWVDSYWGGAVAAIGGALIIGSLPRVIQYRRRRDAIMLGVGAAILANSRPVEGILFCLPVAAALGYWLVKRSNQWEVNLSNVILPLSAILVLAVVFIGYYNWRGTGSPLLFPYVVYQRATFTSPPVLWLSAKPQKQLSNPQAQAYSQEQLQEFEDRKNHFARTSWARTRDVLTFFCGPLLLAPLLTLPWLIRDRKLRLLIAQFLLSFLGLLAVAPFFPHYAAPLTATIFALTLQGMRHLRRWRYRGTPVGIGLTRSIVLITAAMIPIHIAKTVHETHLGISWTNPEMLVRARILSQFESTPGNHLVIVRYSQKHDVHQEWVYNAADIDDSKIVWARQIPGVDLAPLLSYFRNRNTWTIDPDSNDVQLHPYSGTAVSP
jgi:hypothetical protein